MTGESKLKSIEKKLLALVAENQDRILYLQQSIEYFKNKDYNSYIEQIERCYGEIAAYQEDISKILAIVDEKIKT